MIVDVSEPATWCELCAAVHDTTEGDVCPHDRAQVFASLSATVAQLAEPVMDRRYPHHRLLIYAEAQERLAQLMNWDAIDQMGADLGIGGGQ